MSEGATPFREVRVRPVRPDTNALWNDLVRAHHYLGFQNFSGRRLRHVAVLDDRWLARQGWPAAALLGAVGIWFHFVLAVALREDACRVRKGSLPRVLAAFASVAVPILRPLETANIKREMKSLYRNGAEAVAKIIR